MSNLHDDRCFQNHMGIWMTRAGVVEARLELIRAGHHAEAAVDTGEPLDFTVVEGLAIIQVDDVMMRHRSKYGGCSTTRIRRKMRQALHLFQGGQVRGILLDVNSPGGTIDGQQELLRDRDMVASFMPVYAYVRDMACSAALWFIAGCEKIGCDRMSLIGSVGCYTVLYDTTGAMEKEGVTATLVSTGDNKGLGADGEVTPKQIEVVQDEVDQIHEFFVDDLTMYGRLGDGYRLPADGTCVFGEDAKLYGLVDDVCSIDDFISQIISGKYDDKEDALSIENSGHRKTLAERNKPEDEDEEAKAAEEDEEFEDEGEENAEFDDEEDDEEKDGEKDGEDDEEEDDKEVTVTVTTQAAQKSSDELALEIIVGAANLAGHKIVAVDVASASAQLTALMKNGNTLPRKPLVTKGGVHPFKGLVDAYVKQGMSPAKAVMKAASDHPAEHRDFLTNSSK